VIISALETFYNDLRVCEVLLGALANIVSTREGVMGLEEVGFQRSFSVVLKITEIHKAPGEQDAISLTCLLLFRVIQGHPSALQELLNLKSRKGLLEIQKAWLEAAGTSSGVDYCLLLAHAAHPKRRRKS